MWLGWPLIGVNLSIVGVQLGDAWIAAQLGTSALASIGTSGLFLLTLASFGQGFSLPFIGDIAAKWSQGDRLASSKILASSLILLPSIAIGLAILAWFLSRSVFSIFEHPIRVFEQETLYFSIGAIAMILKFGSYAWASYFIGTKRTRVILTASVVTVSVNFYLSYGFSGGFGGLPQLGFLGIPIGTLIASCLEFLTFVFVYLRLEVQFSERIRFPFSHVGKSTLSRHLKTGLPAGVHAAVDVLAWGAILMWLVSQFGNEHHAAAAILLRLMLFSFLPPEGIATALISRIGNHYSQSPSAADRYANTAFKLIAAYMVTCAIAFALFRPLIASLFTSDENVARIVEDCLLVVCAFQFFDAMNITYGNALIGIGDTLWPALVNSVLVVAILVGGGLFVIHFIPGLQSLGVWIVVALYVVHQGLLFRMRWGKKSPPRPNQLTRNLYLEGRPWTTVALKY